MADRSPATFKPLLAKLLSTPEDFTPVDLSAALNHLFTPHAADPVQIGAFLVALHIHRIDRKPESLLAGAQVLRERALEVVVEDREQDFIVDIVGTGGDGHNTFNVSTTAAVVAAGAGARVVKHGSRASTSSSGSADLLQALGCPLPAPPAGAPARIPRMPFAFLLAPHFHPALALLAPARRALPVRTLFNLLGPLLNPARPQGLLLGVADPALGAPFAEALRAGGVDRALVVCGAEGLDEVSCAGATHAWELVDGAVHARTLHPALFGLRAHPLAAVVGGGPAENAATFRALLARGPVPEALGPVMDFVLMNAAALLVVAGRAGDYKEGVELARESVASGRAWAAFETFQSVSREAEARLMETK